MFYSLTGRIVHKDAQFVAISCGSVAFKCFTTRGTLSSLPENGREVTLYTYLSVREDALDLFGFISEDELNAYKLLLGVSGVGPKAALAILSELSPDAFFSAVASGDSKAITAANGVGPKLAQRVIMELKDKISAFSFASSEQPLNGKAGNAASSGYTEALAALISLGYSQNEAAAALKDADRTLSAEELVKIALKNLVIKF